LVICANVVGVPALLFFEQPGAPDLDEPGRAGPGRAAANGGY
jgi:hypothetical protein